MSGIVISLSNNVLKLTISDNLGVRRTSLEIPGDVVNDTQIVNIQEFSNILKSTIFDKDENKNNNKLSLNFILEPQNVITYFITVNKKDGDSTEQIMQGIKSKLKDQSLDELYFSYQKIAPFVYQFVGVKKEVLENILTVGNLTGLEVKSVVPWILLLPKLLGTNEPSIFISKSQKGDIIALSELGGIYFNDVYTAGKKLLNIEQLVKELSVYKRSVPINKIYTFGCNLGSLDPNYEIIPLMLPQQYISDDTKDCEENQLFSYISDINSDILSTQINFVNLIPVPVVEKSNKALVYVGASVAGLVLVVSSAFFLLGRNKNITAGKIAMNNEVPTVLSEKDVNKETSQSTSTNSIETIVLDVLERKNLKIKVENGAGINGLAGKTRDFLVSLGYIVVEIGTSQKPIRNDTLISFKKGDVRYKDMLTGDLEKKYKIIFDESLDSNAGYDVLIVVGTN